jgi:Coenzyme PQQ synthesis protein D (PqqD)
MQAGDRFRVNTPDVTHEVIENEAVIIDLESGNYYSLRGEGAEIWALLAAQSSVDAVVRSLTHRYTCERSDAERAVSGLIADLRAENLIIPFDGAQIDEVARPAADPPTPSTPRRPLEMPVLQKFTDMQELLLLDPIHDVDERGWPHRNVGGRAGRTTD